MAASRAGTVELVAREIATALQPLEQHLSADRRIEFFQDLGLWVPAGLDAAAGAIGTVGVQAAGLAPIIVRLSAAIDGGQPGPIIQEGGALLGALKEVLTAITALGPALDTTVAGAPGLTDAQRTRLRAETQQLPKRLLDHVLITYLEGKSTGVVEALTMVGIIEDLPAFFDPDDFTVLPVRRKVLHLDRLLTLFTDPAELLSEVFDFGSTAFDGTKLFRLLADQFIKHDQEYFYKGPPDTPETPPTLDMYLARMTADPSVSPPGLSAELHVMEGEKISRRTELSPLWTLLLDASATVTSEATAHLTPPLDITLQSAAALALSVSLGLEAKHADGAPVLLLGQAGASRLEIQRFAVTLGLAAQANAGGGVTVEPAAQLALEGGHLLIDLSSGDGFIATVTGGGKIESDFALRALWAPSTGLRLEGSGSLDLAIPVHLELGPVEITTLYISAGIGSGGALPLEISGAFTAELGPITASVDRVGLIVSPTFRDGGNLGPLDLDFAFKPPNGVGLSVDAGVISGGGYLKVDSDRGEYAGALELEFAGFLALKAIGLISTRMPDGSDGFSLLVIITAEFGGGGIQLGYGFTLLAVGGLIGLNRSMNLRMLTEGVRTGRIESVMFPQDVVANAPRIISDLQLFFPAEQGKFLIGPMAKIGWGTPTLISVSLGVIIEIPGNLAVLGVLKCVLPTERLPLLVIQVAFIGAIEFDKSRLWFYAQLFDSRILTMSIDGGMGLLVAWGDNPDLVLTVGGFHPSYTPPALPFPVPPRLSIDVLHTSVALIRVSGYFAVTSNTVQFGAAAELRLGFSDFGIEGHLSFDALFRFSPFAFVIGVSAGVSLKAFGVGLFGIDLRFQLEGPSGWRAQGRGSISLLFFEISADFDISWGEDHNTTLPPIEVLPLLAAEVAKTEGWQTRLPTGGSNPLVNLRPLPDTDQLVLHPLGTLFVRQRSIPLGVRVDRVGTQRPSDGKRFTIAPAPDSGLVQLSVPDEKFAMAQFQDMDDGAKLSKPAYEDQDAGLELSAQLEALSSPRVVRRSARYETHVFDSRPKSAAVPGAATTAAATPVGAGVASTPKRFQNVSSAVFNQFLSGSSTSRSPLSQQEARRKQPFAAEDTVQVTGQRFVVAYVRNNLQALPPTAGVARGATTFRSQTTAADALDEWVAADPALAGKLHVIREAEVAAPLTAPGTWTAANPAPFEAADTGAVRLAGGAVLIVGGRGPTGEALAAVAVFDPVRGTWTAAPELAGARHGHAVTLLADGRVLVTGGRGADGAPLDSAELYDPVAGAWTAVAKPMATARHRHSATQLGNGLVLVTGGTATRSVDSERSLSTAELFDPRTGAWVTDPAKRPPPMAEARAGHQAVLLPDSGRVLVTGGALATGGGSAKSGGSSTGGETALAYCELYDPDANAWAPAASLGTARKGHQGTLLADGSVLVTGGDPKGTGAGGRFDPAALAAAESYDPDTDSWTRAAAPAGGRTGHRAVPLRSGRVLLLGGANSPAGTTGYRSATVYDPDTHAWTTVGGLGTGRRDFAAVELADGRVLAVGGVVRSGAAAPGGTDVLTTTTEIFTP